MRILHTADWHLTERLGGLDRQPDLKARLQEIAHYLDAYNVDVMLVAGDIFSQCTRWDEVETAIKEVNTIFKPYLLRGGTIVAISGNHDNEHLFSILRAAFDLAIPFDPTLAGSDAPRPGGRLYLASEPGVLRLADKDGQVVQFVLLPYPTQTRYLKDEKTRYTSLADKNQRLHSELLRRLNNIMNRALRKDQRSILVSHLHVRGSTLNTPYHLSENEDIMFEQGEIPTHFEYIALGHIHKPQTVLGIPHACYAGSIDCLNWGEREEQKRVLLVDIGPEGRVADPQPLFLNATPFYSVDILGHEQDLQELRERHPDRLQAIVRCRVLYQPGDDLNHVMQQIKEIFPRHSIQTQMVEAPMATETTGTLSASSIGSIGDVVERYLTEQLQEHALKEDVLRAARELLVTLEEGQQ
jgi:exonuclease SbcD